MCVTSCWLANRIQTYNLKYVYTTYIQTNIENTHTHTNKMDFTRAANIRVHMKGRHRTRTQKINSTKLSIYKRMLLRRICLVLVSDAADILQMFDHCRRRVM